MNRISKFWSRLGFFICTPAVVYATEIALKDQAAIKYHQTVEAVKNSPLVGMILYSGGAIVIFVGLILVVFFLIMLLNR